MMGAVRQSGRAVQHVWPQLHRAELGRTRLAHIRKVTTNAPPTPPPAPMPTRIRPSIARRMIRVFKYTTFFIGASAAGVLAIAGGILIHDAFTYSDKHLDRVPEMPLALHPETGGPKNLPIVSKYIDDDDDDEQQRLATKPRLVIVGGGWGAIGALSTLHSGDYHVTVIASETFTTFTPLLPSAAVGTVQVRSLVEPLRKLIARLHGHYIHAKAVDLVMSERLLEVETVSSVGEPARMYIPYDKLVIAVGSVSATHGIDGLENCYQLKTIADAQSIRGRILDNFEAASQPTTTPAERKRLLSFVICGGGATGVETAAEIYDLCQEDIVHYFPKICRKEVSISVIQSREHILNTYSEAISKYAEAKFNRDDVNLIVNARVEAVFPDHVIYSTKDANGKKVMHNIPNNFTLWSTGIAMNPFTERVSNLLPNQVHKKAIEVDAHLRVKGSPLGDVYAIGDCATIETDLVSHLLELVQEADTNHDGKIDFDEWNIMAARIKARVPAAAIHLSDVKDIFDKYDCNKNHELGLNEVTELLKYLSTKMTSLPATAQVASQQGKYLGLKLNALAHQSATLAANDLPSTTDEVVYKPFVYHHLGSLAYIGNAAVFDFGSQSFMGGLVAMYAWRSIYWSESVSMRTRALLMIDWVIRGIWGRDLSRL